MIQCTEEYTPSCVQSGEHPPLRVYVRNYRKDSAFGKNYQPLKAQAATLEQAKELVERFYARNPDWLPQPPITPPLTREQKLAGAIQAALDEDVIKTVSWRKHLLDLLKEPS